MQPDGRKQIITVRGLAKRYGEVRALNDLEFTVYEGELFGFLGPNGAGKTTTINILTGLARPDAGRILIAGIDCSGRPKAAQHLMGVVPDESNLYPELTGFENLSFCGALYGISKRNREARARELLERFGLTEAAHRAFGGYSKGMKRKLTIAAGIIHSPAILFLDEPTSGIDVASARQIRRLIAGLNSAGTTIMLTTHYIEEAERLCGRVAFIVRGRIVEIDTVEALMRRADERHAMQFTVGIEGGGVLSGVCKRLAAEFPELESRSVAPNSIRVESLQPVGVGPLVRFLEDQGMEVFEARKLLPSLEEVFVRVTGIEASVMQGEQGDAAEVAGGAVNAPAARSEAGEPGGVA